MANLNYSVVADQKIQPVKVCDEDVVRFVTSRGDVATAAELQLKQQAENRLEKRRHTVANILVRQGYNPAAEIWLGRMAACAEEKADLLSAAICDPRVPRWVQDALIPMRNGFRSQEEAERQAARQEAEREVTAAVAEVLQELEVARAALDEGTKSPIVRAHQAQAALTRAKRVWLDLPTLESMLEEEPLRDIVAEFNLRSAVDAADVRKKASAFLNGLLEPVEAAVEMAFERAKRAHSGGQQRPLQPGERTGLRPAGKTERDRRKKAGRRS